MVRIGSRGVLFAALLAAAVAAVPASRAQPQIAAPRLLPSQPMPPAELEALVDGVVRQAIDQDHIAGVTVSVVQDGQVVLRKGYGFADVARGRRVDPDRTLFRVGSITKTFTWLMAMNAVQAGRMSLDAPLNTYLPPNLRVPDQGFSQQIRLRDAMTHTPGFEDRVLKGLFIRDPAQLQPLDDYLASHRPGRVWEPGTVSAYSNYGAALAGAALAHAEGRPWQDLLETEVLKPAGMDHTTGREPYPRRAGLPAPMPADLVQGISPPYRWSGAGFTAQPYEYVGGFAPVGAISSTAADMARYMTLQLNGGVIDGHAIYEPAVAAARRTPMIAFPGGAAVDGGVFQFPMPGGFMGYGHNGATMDFNANMTLVPDLKLGVFVATNTDRGQRLIGDLASLVVSRFYAPATTPLPPAPALLSQGSVYGGEFMSTRTAFHGLEAFMMGLRTTQVSVARPGYLMVGVERFIPAGRPGLFQDVDSPRVQLQAVPDHGRAAKLILPGGELWRRDWVHQSRTLALGAISTALACIGVLFGLFGVARWQLPQTPVQRLAGRLRGVAAGLWLVAVGAFGIKAVQALADQTTIVFGWPGALMLTASSTALAAAVLSWAATVMLPQVWAGADGWSQWRKLRFTLTVAVFSAFGLLLAVLGALQPWNP
jgi:CubicO group peptidase (beta-lactamase class C family)